MYKTIPNRNKSKKQTTKSPLIGEFCAMDTKNKNIKIHEVNKSAHRKITKGVIRIHALPQVSPTNPRKARHRDHGDHVTRKEKERTRRHERTQTTRTDRGTPNNDDRRKDATGHEGTRTTAATKQAKESIPYRIMQMGPMVRRIERRSATSHGSRVGALWP